VLTFQRTDGLALALALLFAVVAVVVSRVVGI